MERIKALEWLKSIDSHERLQAARFFSRFARPNDRTTLITALAKEDVIWIKTALKRAIELASGDKTLPSVNTESNTISQPAEAISDIYAQAIEETTQRLVHEVEPILGTIRLYAEKEINNYEESKTRQQLDRLDSLVRAIDLLSRAAAPPVNISFDLSELIQKISDSESLRHEIKVEFAGSAPLIVIGDNSLIEIAVTNGLRNAMEAMKEMEIETNNVNKIVVNWGETDKEYWISILDRGIGLPSGTDRVWEIGASTKLGHLGMGLALAQRAILSLGGKINLNSRSDGGTQYEFRWQRVGELMK